jgi:hypothetical protein
MQSHIVIKESANFSDVTGDSTEPEDCCDQGLGMGSLAKRWWFKHPG